MEERPEVISVTSNGINTNVKANREDNRYGIDMKITNIIFRCP